MLLLNECLLLLFRYRLSPETFGYTVVHARYLTWIHTRNPSVHATQDRDRPVLRSVKELHL